MPIIFWVGCSILLIILFSMAVGLFITLGIIMPKRRSLLETSMLEEEKFPGIMEFYRGSLKKKYYVKSRYGYNLAVYYLSDNEDSNKYIIMSHGHTYTHHGLLKYARMMMKFGYQVILYDQRYHGDSGGRYTSLGYYEKFDLYDIITDTLERFGDEIEVSTFGESMGAATVILEAEIDNRIMSVYADCGFDNLDHLLQEILQKNIRPRLKIFLPFARLAFRLVVGVRMSRISPITALASLSVPVFLSHGENDDFIRFDHTVRIFNYYQGKKTLYIAGNDAKHAESFWKNQEEFEEKIKEHIVSSIHE